MVWQTVKANHSLTSLLTIVCTYFFLFQSLLLKNRDILLCVVVQMFSWSWLFKEQVIQTGYRDRGLKLWHTNDISLREERAYVWVCAYSGRQQSGSILALRDLFFTEGSSKTMMLRCFGFCLKKVEAISTHRNSESFTPRCIDFSCYCRSVRENQIEKKKNLYYFIFWHLCAPVICVPLYFQKLIPKLIRRTAAVRTVKWLLWLWLLW